MPTTSLKLKDGREIDVPSGVKTVGDLRGYLKTVNVRPVELVGEALGSILSLSDSFDEFEKDIKKKKLTPEQEKRLAEILGARREKRKQAEHRKHFVIHYGKGEERERFDVDFEMQENIDDIDDSGAIRVSVDGEPYFDFSVSEGGHLSVDFRPAAVERSMGKDKFSLLSDVQFYVPDLGWMSVEELKKKLFRRVEKQ